MIARPCPKACETEVDIPPLSGNDTAHLAETSPVSIRHKGLPGCEKSSRKPISGDGRQTSHAPDGGKGYHSQDEHANLWFSARHYCYFSKRKEPTIIVCKIFLKVWQAKIRSRDVADWRSFTRRDRAIKPSSILNTLQALL
jgi:hypothetical protein